MTDSSNLTIQSLMDRLPGAFVPEKAAGVNSTVQFNLSGDKGGSWYVRIKNQSLEVEQGEAPGADLVFAADAQDALDIFTGKLNPMRAYMSGRVKFSGNTSLAMRLSNLFDVRSL
jgi:putative sterol carrier protein